MASCTNCGRVISDSAVACPNCGHPGPGATPQAQISIGISTSPGSAIGPGGKPLAGWGQRAVAAIIDWFIIGIPAWILMAILSIGVSSQTKIDPETGRITGGSGFLGGFFVGILLIVVIGILYRVLLEGGPKGQTVGKMVMKIQVRDMNTGGPIGYGRAFLRWLVAGVLWAFFYLPGLIDVLFPLWDPKRQTIHDKAASSVVTMAV